MAEKSVRRARLLFILSEDFGELANAMYLVRGQECDPVLLMPGRLFALHQGRLNARTRVYSTAGDVLTAVDQERPDLVLLFCGYLYVSNDIMSVEDLENLIRELCAHGCRLVTSDPFLGLLASLDADTFGNHPARRALTEVFSRLFTLLKPFPLYLVNPRGTTGTTNVTFFNPHIIVPPAAVASFARAIHQELGADPSRRRWLFVLSHEDYGAQMMHHGRDRFADMLAGMLRQTLAAGRQPVLVGPPACFAALQGRATGIDGLIPLTFCPYDLFLALLLEAEYVFWWNVFSNSVLARAVNRLPIFFFDRGHLARAVRPFFDLAMRWYYPDSELPYLDPTEPLEPVTLAEAAARQDRGLAGAIENLRQAPAPRVMVEQLMAL
jgi:hypothetical protein